MNTLAAANALS